MKKILAVILALLMLTVAGLCLAEATEPVCVETWEIVAMLQDGVQMEEGTYPYIAFFLYDDGTVQVEFGGRMNAEGTFEMTDDPAGYVFNMNGQSAPLVYEAETGYLYMENPGSGQTGVFMLCPNRPAQINAESIDEFQGTWHINALINGRSLLYTDSAAGQEYLNSMNITDTDIVIEGSDVTVCGILHGVGALADGKLDVTTPNGEIIITLTEGNSIILDVPGADQTLRKMFADKE